MKGSDKLVYDDKYKKITNPSREFIDTCMEKYITHRELVYLTIYVLEDARDKLILASAYEGVVAIKGLEWLSNLKIQDIITTRIVARIGELNCSLWYGRLCRRAMEESRIHSYSSLGYKEKDENGIVTKYIDLIPSDYLFRQTEYMNGFNFWRFVNFDGYSMSGRDIKKRFMKIRNYFGFEFNMHTLNQSGILGRAYSIIGNEEGMERDAFVRYCKRSEYISPKQAYNIYDSVWKDYGLEDRYIAEFKLYGSAR